MGEQLAARDPEVRGFEATVEAIDGRDVVLSETYFYAESGGQPADRGTIGGTLVEHVRSENGDHIHSLAAEPEFDVGDTVAGEIDDTFRTYCMRAHTASHILYGAGRRLLDELGYAGFDIGDSKVRVDLTTTTSIDDGTLVELERLSNRAVWDSIPVSWTQLSVEEAHDREEIAFNTKTEEGVMAGSDTVRVVTVGAEGGEPWDVAACGGTHVSNTREIGPIEVLSRSNPGEGRTRIEFTVGPAAIEHRATVRRAAFDAASAVDSSVEELNESVERVVEERDELETQLQTRTEQLLELQVRSFDRIDRDDATWAIGSVDSVDTNDAGETAKALAGETADVVAIVGEASPPYVVVASDGSVDAGETIGAITDEFGGGGGGSPTFAQGGGLSGSTAEILEYLRQ